MFNPIETGLEEKSTPPPPPLLRHSKSIKATTMTLRGYIVRPKMFPLRYAIHDDVEINCVMTTEQPPS